MLPPRANGRKDEGAARRSCARRCDDRCSQNPAPRFAQNPPNGEIIIDPAAPANSNTGQNNDPTMISRQQQRSSSRPSSPAHSAHDGGAEEEDHHQQTPGASSSVRSLVKNRTFSHPLFGDDDQAPSSADIAATGASTEGDEASGSGGLANPHATATETKASSSSFNNAILSESSASGGGAAAAAALLSEQAFGPSRSSSTRRSAPLTLEQRRKHKRSSARSTVTAAVSSTSRRSSSRRSKQQSLRSASKSSERNGGSSQQDDCSAAAESEERSTLERQLIQLKVELAQVKSESEEWRHAHGTVSEENHGLRFQLGVMLDLEDESHARQKVLEEEVRQLRFEAEERERAEQVRAKVEAQRRAEAQRQREKEEKEADLQQRRSGSFSSIGDILTHLIGDDNGGEGNGSANDDDSFDPYSSETKKEDHKRQNSVEALLGMSGLDEDDVRYAAAHERDCLLRENDRLKIDLDGAVSERDELRARVAELEKKELERTQREAHAHAAAANQRASLHSAGGGGESSSSSASCTDAASSSGASCSPSTPPTAAPPSSLRGYLSKVTSSRMLASGGGSNKNFNKNQSSGGGRSITPPIVAIPPESLLWDSEDDLNVSGGRGQWSRAA